MWRHLMFMLFLALIPLGSADAPPSYIPRPGAVLEDLGSIIPVYNYAEVSFDTTCIEDIFSYITHQKKVIQTYTLTVQQSSLSLSIKDVLLKLLHSLDKQVSEFSSPIEQNVRNKRGLIDGVGKLASYLFGVSTHEEVNNKFKGYQKAIDTISVNIHTSFEALHNITDTVNILITATNSLKTTMEKYRETTQKFETIVLYYAQISNYKSFLQDTIHKLTSLKDDIILAVHGTVLPSLFPPKALQAVIYRIQTESEFRPLFSAGNFSLYYGQLKSFLSLCGLSILIPLQPIMTYNAYNVHPFPIIHNSTALTIESTDNLLIHSTDH